VSIKRNKSYIHTYKSVPKVRSVQPHASNGRHPQRSREPLPQKNWRASFRSAPQPCVGGHRVATVLQLDAENVSNLLFMFWGEGKQEFTSSIADMWSSPSREIGTERRLMMVRWTHKFYSIP